MIAEKKNPFAWCSKRQHDSFMNDISVYDRVFRFPGSPMIIDFMKSMIGTFTGKFGKFLLDRGWFGP